MDITKQSPLVCPHTFFANIDVQGLTCSKDIKKCFLIFLLNSLKYGIQCKRKGGKEVDCIHPARNFL